MMEFCNWLSAILFIAGVILIKLVFQYLLTPIKELAAAAHKIKSGDLAATLPEQTLYEFAELRDALVSMIFDVSANHQEIIKSNLNLELLVAARTNELAGTNRQLEKELALRFAAEGEMQHAIQTAEAANYSKTMFLANMSHELRTPLNAIIGFSELISSEFNGPIQKNYRGYIDDIHNSGLHLLSLISDVLDISRIELAQTELDKEDVNFSSVVDACLKIVNWRATQKNISIEISISPDVTEIWADTIRLKQILINLLDNAIKYTPNDGLVKWSGKTGQRAKMYPTRTNGYKNDKATEFFRQV